MTPTRTRTTTTIITWTKWIRILFSERSKPLSYNSSFLVLNFINLNKPAGDYVTNHNVIMLHSTIQ
jgi:hypothetical protein